MAAGSPGATFIDKLKELLKVCRYLNHLAISGLNLGTSVNEIFPLIKDSERLCSVHLSNNHVPLAMKELFFNQLNLSYEQAKKDCEQWKVEIPEKEDDRFNL